MDTELEEDRPEIDWREIVWVIAVAIIVVGLWALDQYLSERVTEQERIEYHQRRLADPKFIHV